jgi:microcompartment protein CcmK/EutM
MPPWSGLWTPWIFTRRCREEHLAHGPMHLARVIGDVVATQKDPQLAGIKLLLVQPLTPEGALAGRPIVAVDAVGAGVGENVFFVRGKEASFPFYPAEPPVDAGIVGIVDHWNVERT